MYATMNSAVLYGFGAKKVSIEVDIARGLPNFIIVGMAENSVKEARVRVSSAIVNSGLEMPRSRISVNLAPADLQKSGTAFDLSIALALLMASGRIAPPKMAGVAAIGELSLTGDIKPVRGILALAESIKAQGFKTLLVPKKNACEAALINDLEIKCADNLAQLVNAVALGQVDSLEDAPSNNFTDSDDCELDIADVVGQEEAKRALLIAAAGGHNLLFVGGPGSGKSMMAHRLASILPPLNYRQALMLTKIYSIAGLSGGRGLLTKRPFRSPHHSTTKAGLVGGGSGHIRPGEISLATHGVLFLDELLEFSRSVLEVLRQPLESGEISLSRARECVTFPAIFSLVAALNPCPCGNFGQSKNICTCSPHQVERYQGRLSGPMIDRIDLHVNVLPVNLALMNSKRLGLSSKDMRALVTKARQTQSTRFSNDRTNAQMGRVEIKQWAELHDDARQFLLSASEKLGVSARGYDRIIKVARTIADLEESPKIHTAHIGEALHYRPSAVLGASVSR